MIIRKITYVEMVEFVASNHGELEIVVDSQFISMSPKTKRKVVSLLTEGEMEKYLKSKGFREPKNTWVLKRSKPNSPKWMLLSGRAA